MRWDLLGVGLGGGVGVADFHGIAEQMLEGLRAEAEIISNPTLLLIK